MNENEANMIASILGGYAWDSGCGYHVVIINRPNGTITVVSDEVVCEYTSLDVYEEGAIPSATIHLH